MVPNDKLLNLQENGQQNRPASIEEMEVEHMLARPYKTMSGTLNHTHDRWKKGKQNKMAANPYMASLKLPGLLYLNNTCTKSHQ